MHPNEELFGEPSPLEEALCALCADDKIDAHSLIEALPEVELWEAARRNEVTSIVAHRLGKAGIGGGDRDSWARAHAEQVTRISGFLAELDRVASLLAASGVPVVALKNAGIARAIHPCPGCCPMGDLDLLISRSHFDKAHPALIGDGYQYQLRDPIKARRSEPDGSHDGGEYWKVLPGGDKLWLELQWRPVGGRWIRADQEPNVDDLLDRSTKVEGSAIRLLAPEDNLLQVALHTAKHSYVRAPGFRLHTDIDRIVRRRPVDWNRFLDEVAGHEVRTAVYFSLAIPKSLFSTPIPEWVLADLEPVAWRRRSLEAFLRAAGLFDPGERKFGRLGYIVFNALLYDDLHGLWRAMFPARDNNPEFRRALPPRLWLYRLRRLADLAFRRVAP